MRNNVDATSVFFILVGVACWWFARRLYRRPVETVKQMLESVRGGDRYVPKWLRAEPDVEVTKGKAVIFAAFGTGFIVFGLYIAIAEYLR